jgi:uncharacterized protein YdgA (DUF945 family)
MRTATPNLVILTAQIGENITGTAIDADILVNFAVANTEVNKRLFVPEAQLVCTGKFRLGKEIATIGIWISSVIAIISIPEPRPTETELAPAKDIVTIESVEASEPLPTQFATKLTRAQKTAATRAANKAKTKAESKSESVLC